MCRFTVQHLRIGSRQSLLSTWSVVVNNYMHVQLNTHTIV